MLGKSKNSRPTWWFNGDLPWYKVNNHLKQIQDTYIYLDPPRGAKWMLKGATKQPLRVQTPPLGGCWCIYIYYILYIYYIFNYEYTMYKKVPASNVIQGMYRQMPAGLVSISQFERFDTV